MIGIMYCVACISFFFHRPAGVVDADRSCRTRSAVLSNEQFNQLFTMHGTIMLFMPRRLCLFANLVLPLQIGAPGVFPAERLFVLAVRIWRHPSGQPIAITSGRRGLSSGGSATRAADRTPFTACAGATCGSWV